MLEIHERVISCLVTANVCEAVAKFHGLFDVVISLLNAFRFCLLCGATLSGKQEESRAEKKDRSILKAAKEVFETGSDSTHRPTSSRLEEHFA